ncbi:unnamed protein product, partial [Rhizoctonia solani]
SSWPLVLSDDELPRPPWQTETLSLICLLVLTPSAMKFFTLSTLVVLSVSGVLGWPTSPLRSLVPRQGQECNIGTCLRDQCCITLNLRPDVCSSGTRGERCGGRFNCPCRIGVCDFDSGESEL